MVRDAEGGKESPIPSISCSGAAWMFSLVRAVFMAHVRSAPTTSAGVPCGAIRCGRVFKLLMGCYAAPRK